MTTDTRDDGTEDGTAAQSPAPVRYPTAIAVGGGLAAAVGSSFIPMNAIEGFVSAYGIAELLPAAAPPLGTTARLALSTGIGTLTAGALLALLPRGENEVMGYESAVTGADVTEAAGDPAAARGGSGVARLAGWLRTLRFGKAEAEEDVVTDFADLGRLRMRMGDQHPDAPVRAPIMANSDLGAPFDSPADLPEAPTAVADREQAPERRPLDLDASMAFAPAAESEPEPAPAPLRASAMRFAPPLENLPPLDDGHEAPAPAPDNVPMADIGSLGVPAPADLHPSDLAQVAIPELLDRLERGLARRRELARVALTDLGRSANHAMALPATPVASLDEAASEAPAEAASRFRLRMAPSAAAIDDAGSPEQDDAAMITTGREPFEFAALSEMPMSSLDVGQADDIAADTPASDPSPADEDMDAALRDALATLRQLSDRQRNA